MGNSDDDGVAAFAALPPEKREAIKQELYATLRDWFVSEFEQAIRGEGKYAPRGALKRERG